MRRFKLVKPGEATGKTKELYDDIMKTWGKRRLVPVFGFWGRDPDVLSAAWIPCKKFEHGESKAPKDILVGACLVGAMSVGCKRCIVFHSTDLTDRLGVSEERAQIISEYQASFKEGKLSEQEYIALRFADCLCQGTLFERDEWEKLSSHYTDDQIFEIAVVSLVEGMYAKYGQVMAPYDESVDWPEEYRPAGAYGQVMGR
jgi:alkylhydroperoxidase family enzyme